eukprot:TRINITY_DN8541_c0_g3_i2.p1 TRINITY_DN8541_c0_g3~~TRINITY_DN8541_c0_g3_i2.p1  ORF type:complete len:541 (+),score=61.65 TRINITY_DN8541_c0_g3_i2:1298-2920(+)
MYCRVRDWLGATQGKYFAAVCMFQRLLHHPELAFDRAEAGATAATAKSTSSSSPVPDDDEGEDEPDDDDEELTMAAIDSATYQRLREAFNEIPNDKDPDPATDGLWPEGGLEAARQNYDFPSAKFEIAVKIIENHLKYNDKVLVFSTWIGPIEKLKSFIDERLSAISPKTATAHGQTNRDKVFSAFRNGEIDVLLMTIQSGANGLNLQNASAVILLDIPWNPSKMSQAICRAYRVGQQKPVHAYRLVSRGTVEEKICLLALTKQWVTNHVVDNTTDVATRFAQRYGLPFSEVIDVSQINSAPTAQEDVCTAALHSKIPVLDCIKGLAIVCVTYSDFFEPALQLSRAEKEEVLQSGIYERNGVSYGQPRMLPLSVIDEEDAEVVEDKNTVKISGAARPEQQQQQPQPTQPPPVSTGDPEDKYAFYLEDPEDPVPPAKKIPKPDQFTLPPTGLAKLPSSLSPPPPASQPQRLNPAPARAKQGPIVVQRAVPKIATYDNTAVIRVYTQQELDKLDAMFAYDLVRMQAEEAKSELLRDGPVCLK